MSARVQREAIEEQNLRPVNEAVQEYRVIEDGALAHYLQEREIEHHYASNVEQRRTVMGDIKTAKDLQDEEDRKARILTLDEQEQLKDMDERVAGDIQEDLFRQHVDEQQHKLETEQRDSEMAKIIMERQKHSEQRQKRKDRELAERLSELDVRSQRERPTPAPRHMSDEELAKRLQDEEAERVQRSKEKSKNIKAVVELQDEELARFIHERDMHEAEMDMQRDKQFSKKKKNKPIKMPAGEAPPGYYPNERGHHPDERGQQPRVRGHPNYPHEDRAHRQNDRGHAGYRPDDRGHRPAERGHRPDERGQRPDERGQRPDERGQRPDERGHRPDERGHRPDERGQRPDERGQRPDERGHRPHERGHRPDERGHRPDERGHRPDERGHRPDERGHRPDERGHQPRDRDHRHPDDWGQPSSFQVRREPDRRVTPQRPPQPSRSFDDFDGTTPKSVEANLSDSPIDSRRHTTKYSQSRALENHARRVNSEKPRRPQPPNSLNGDPQRPEGPYEPKNTRSESPLQQYRRQPVANDALQGRGATDIEYGEGLARIADEEAQFRREQEAQYYARGGKKKKGDCKQQ